MPTFCTLGPGAAAPALPTLKAATRRSAALRCIFLCGPARRRSARMMSAGATQETPRTGWNRGQPLQQYAQAANVFRCCLRLAGRRRRVRPWDFKARRTFWARSAHKLYCDYLSTTLEVLLPPPALRYLDTLGRENCFRSGLNIRAAPGDIYETGLWLSAQPSKSSPPRRVRQHPCPLITCPAIETSKQGLQRCGSVPARPCSASGHCCRPAGVAPDCTCLHCALCRWTHPHVGPADPARQSGR